MFCSKSSCNILIDVDCTGVQHGTVPSTSLTNLIENILTGNITTGTRKSVLSL